jgi:hypothetical protein
MERYWAVIMDDDNSICYTWDKKHPEDKRKEKTVRVYAIYPRKKDALSDVKFRGCSKVKEITIVS